LAEHAATLVIEALQQQPVEKTAASPPPPPLRILDLCTGSGCIALLLHHRLKEAGIPVEITAADKKEESLRLASRNIHALQAAQSVHTAKVDLFNDDEFTRLCRRKGPFDLIVSNPPYIPALEWHTLKKNVREWEDSEALLGDVDGRGDGLAFYRRIAALAAKKNVLSLRFSEMPNLVLEVGHKQAERVRDIMVESDCFSKTAIWDDPWKISRGVLSWSSR
jgi:release factor glutamine methyltransferase